MAELVDRLEAEYRAAREALARRCSRQSTELEPPRPESHCRSNLDLETIELGGQGDLAGQARACAAGIAGIE